MVDEADKSIPLMHNVMREHSSLKDTRGVGAHTQEAAIHKKQRLSMPMKFFHGSESLMVGSFTLSVCGEFGRFDKKKSDVSAVSTSHKGKP